jgi:citrate lyase synthetase
LRRFQTNALFISYLKKLHLLEDRKEGNLSYGENISTNYISKNYTGWHYHAVVFTKRIEKTFKKVGFKTIKTRYNKNGYLTYLLQAH